MLVDKNEERLLLFNRASNDVAVMDLDSTEISIHSNFGQDDISHGKINDVNLFFLSDSIYGVSSSNKINMYGLKGNYIESMRFDNYTVAPISNFKLVNDSIVYYVRIPEGNTGRLEYYEYPSEIVVKSNIKSNQESSLVRFPQKDLFTKDYFHPYTYNHFFGFFETKNELFYINSNGANMYVYDLLELHGKLKREVKLNLDYYNQLEIEFGATTDMEESIAQAFCSPIIKGVYTNESNLFVVYKEGFSRDFIRRYADEHEGFPYTERPQSQYYISYFLNEEKVSRDVMIPKEYGEVKFIESADYILSKKYPTEESDLNGTTTYYVLSLTKKNE
ncbi:hypothetical protein ACFO3O_11540 [Dokdonia ponticola]|uniref:6-bladed beta-propeller n=1 Tax=Dokdonia ponticola TaxID=2041041 RepID=A0ABV9HXR2_9FLAO